VGIIQFQHDVVHARSVIYGDELIHSVVGFNNDFENVYWGLKQIDKNDPASQSAEVRRF
jgi:hypothetical protein